MRLLACLTPAACCRCSPLAVHGRVRRDEAAIMGARVCLQLLLMLSWPQALLGAEPCVMCSCGCWCCSRPQVMLGALDLRFKTARMAMTPLQRVLMLSEATPLSYDTLRLLLVRAIGSVEGLLGCSALACAGADRACKLALCQLLPRHRASA